MVCTARATYPDQITRSLSVNKPYVVVIFGRTGVGISSLVNLIAGYPVSNAHSNAKTSTTSHRIKPACTMKLAGSEQQFCFYEVPGFGGRVPESTILKMIRNIELDRGIDLFIYCLRKQKAMAKSNTVRRIRDSVPRQQVPMIAVVTELERFETKGGAGMEAWWDFVLDEDGRTNGTVVERMCFEEYDRFDAHACVTTLPPRETNHNPNLWKRRDLSEEQIRRVILDTCGRPKRGGEWYERRPDHQS